MIIPCSNESQLFSVIVTSSISMSRSGHNPVIPPRPDLSYMSAGHGTAELPPPPPERTTSSTKTPVRKEAPPIPPHPDSDWFDREELRMRELEEARARAAQMEKTMRWWSDCTANWREKWSKVRNERNKMREECRQLRSKLEVSVKDYCSVKRERNSLRSDVSNLKNVVEQYHSGSLVSQEQSAECLEPKDKPKDVPDASICSSESHKSGSDQEVQTTLTITDNPDRLNQNESSSNMAAAGNQEDFVSKLLLRKDKDNQSSSSSHSGTSKSERRRQKDGEAGSPSEDALVQNMLQFKLEELQKTLQTEREDKIEQQKTLETLQSELSELQCKYEVSTQEKDNALQQLSALQQEHVNQLERVSSELADESLRGNSMDRQVTDLRKELERLQQENAQEWAKRERLETQKLALERENKRVRKEVETLEEELTKKSQQNTALLDTDLKAAKLQVAEKTKELSDVRHTHSKCKKSLQERTAELDHAKSRAEQYETDVKKIRTRIDELKRELSSAEDEADQQAHQVRKLQRSNDELQQQVENLNVQVQHLHSRLMRSNPMLASRGTSRTSCDTNDSTTEGATDED